MTKKLLFALSLYIVYLDIWWTCGDHSVALFPSSFISLSLFFVSLSLSCFCFVCYCLVDNECEVGWLVDEDTLDYHVFCVASIHGTFF